MGRWILGATSGAAVIPGTYRLQAGDADDTTSFDDHPTFHEASLERPPGSAAGATSVSFMRLGRSRRESEVDSATHFLSRIAHGQEFHALRAKYTGAA